MSAAAPRLIVGLGNPGAEYTETRHNAGFWFCERLADQLGVRFNHESRFHGLVANARDAGVWLLMPQTFMNRSGQAIGALARFWLGRVRACALGARDVLGVILRGRAALKPALVRHRLAEDASERALFALGASLAPGMLAVSLDPEGPLLHVLHEDDADDEDLAAIAYAARRASPP